MRNVLRAGAIAALASAGLLLLASSSQAQNFTAFNRAFGAGSPFGVPINGPATWIGTASFGAPPGPRSIMVNSFDASFTTVFTNPTPPTAAGVVSSMQFVSVTGPLSPGTFAAGNGPGSFLFNPPPDPTFGTRIGTAQVIVPGGASQFGGSVAHTFKFLSQLTLNFGPAGLVVGTFPLLEVQGVTTPPGATKATQSFTGTFVFTMTPTMQTTINLRANFFPWTTGQAIGKDNGGRFNTTVTLTGYDNRTAMGTNGSVQFVAPFLFSSFNAGAFGVNHLSGVNTLRYELPEPGSTMLLGAGLTSLFVLSRIERRRRGRNPEGDRRGT